MESRDSSLRHPVHVKFVNKLDSGIIIAHAKKEEEAHANEWERLGPFRESLGPGEESARVTCLGWKFWFIGIHGNNLYASLKEEDSPAPRVNHFTPNEEHSRETSSSNPLLVFVHKSRFPVEPDLTSVDDDRGRPLRSLRGESVRSVAFHNQSPHAVAMFWLNYRGIRVHYGDIGPGNTSLMETYVTHPWQFVDRTTNLDALVNDVERFDDDGERVGRYYVDSRPYFFPPEMEEGEGGGGGGGGRGGRHLVVIHAPVCALRALALTAVRREIAEDRLKLDARYVPGSLIREVARPIATPAFLTLDEIDYFND